MSVPSEQMEAKKLFETSEECAILAAAVHAAKAPHLKPWP